MTYYLLPRSNINLYKNISYLPTDESPPIFISNSLANYLYIIKENIDNKEQQWDIYKKYTNPFEYIHSIVPFRKKCVSKHKPLSRSYFKMVELCQLFSLININLPEINTFHLAEGPGGFIEAIARKRTSIKGKTVDKYYGMTLLDNKEDVNIPSWKKSADFLKEFENNVILENGIDGTGNILSLENFTYVSRKYGSSMDIVTADGGFDFSMDFNQQEIMIGKLLFSQIAFAVCLQKKGGSFILKIFDCFMQHTVDLLELLASFYEKTYIVKPQTSRYANSEKYIVCTGFLYNNSNDFYSYFYECFENIVSINDKNCLRFLKSQTNYVFLQKLEEYNAIFGQKQIQNIHYTFALMDNKGKSEKIDSLIKINIKKSVDWCIKHGINYNVFSVNSNIFITI
uniref:Ribosomal RNA methyltransferase FtsJ domain-containing protein n=1 Tax=viral metagenome TaxID=1070528 RepID=A0A6C0HZQ4_9ZZZZ